MVMHPSLPRVAVSLSPIFASQDVCSGRSGHAEVVLVDYDPAVVTYDELLEVFWKTHDPTQVMMICHLKKIFRRESAAGLREWFESKIFQGITIQQRYGARRKNSGRRRTRLCGVAFTCSNCSSRSHMKWDVGRALRLERLLSPKTNKKCRPGMARVLFVNNVRGYDK